MKFHETNLAHNVSHGLYHEKAMDLAEAHIDKLYETLFTGTAALLKDQKSKEHPVSFIVTEMDGKMVAAATVEFFSNGDAPGNWSLVWSFDKEDLPKADNATVIKLSDALTHSYFKVVAGTKWGMRFEDTNCLVVLLTYAIEQLYKWLDENAKEGSKIEIELDNVFVASVEVIDGKKVFAVEPAGEIKTLIKDDQGNEK